MKNFRVQILYDGYYANLTLQAEDSVESIEKSVLDKLGRNEIKFKKDGFTHGKWITYEEVVNDRRPIQYKTVLGVKMATGTPEVRET
jgi:hypothetical protein